MKGRPDLHVVARFLDALSDNHGVSKSQLQRAVGVNYDIFQRYLELLTKKGYVVDQDLVTLTPAGNQLRQDLAAWLTRLFAV